jgi:hypothetical protein
MARNHLRKSGEKFGFYGVLRKNRWPLASLLTLKIATNIEQIK